MTGLSAIPSTGVRETARNLRSLERRLSRLERTGNLAYSSIDDGTLDATANGTTVLTIGQQFDQTYVVAPLIGPQPPIPTDPVCSPELSGATVVWDGLYMTDDGSVVDATIVAPMDFSRVEIHASPDSGDLAETADTLVGTFETPRGGSTWCPIPTAGTNYVRLVVRTLSGNRSDPSGPVAVTPITGDDITADVISIANAAADAAAAALTAAGNAVTAANGKNKNTYSTSSPGATPNTLGDNWFRLDGSFDIIEQWKGNGGTTWTQVTLSALVISSVDAGTISTGILSADRIGANTITSSMLIVADLTNVVYDPKFDSALGVSWQNPAYAAIGATAARDGSRALQVTLNGTDQQLFNLPVDALTVETGDGFRVAVTFKSTTAIPPDGVQLNVRTKDAAGAFTTIFGATATPVDPATTIPSGTWVTATAIVVIPTGGLSLSVFLEFPAAYSSGVVTIDNVSINRAANGSLIVDGSVTADMVAAGAINAAHIEAGVLEAGRVMASAITVGTISLDPVLGIQIPQPDGGIITFPADGTAAKITADVIATSLQVKGGFSLSGVGTIVGELDLANGVATPTLAPSVSQYWPSVVSNMGNGSSDQTGFVAGLESHHSDATKLVVCSMLTGTSIRVINKSDYLIGQFPDPTNGKAWTNAFFAWGGIARIGTNYFVLGSDNNRNGDTYLYKIDSATFNKTAEARIGNSTYFQGFHPRLVSTGTYVGYVFVGISSQLMVQWYNPTTMVPATGLMVLATSVPPQSVGDAYWGDAGSGAGASTLWVSLKKGTFDSVMCWTSVTVGGTATRTTTHDFKRANGTQMLGMTYESTQGRMIHYDNTGLLWTYSRFTGALTVTASYTYYDGDNSNYPGTVGSGTTIVNGVDVSGTASGTHETLPSPSRVFTIGKRSWPRFETSAAPDEGVTDSTRVDKANRIGLYMSIGGGTQFRYAYLPVGTRAVSGVDTMPGSGVVPTSNGFSTAGTAPGLVKSAATDADGSLIRMVGDGSWRLGRLSGGADGVVKLGNAGSGLNGLWMSGVVANTSDGSALLTFTHNLGSTPKYATVQGHGSLPMLFRWTSQSTTTVTFEVRRTDTNALVASTALTVSCLVVA